MFELRNIIQDLFARKAAQRAMNQKLKKSSYYLDQLETQHQLWLLLLDHRLYTAPLEAPFTSHLDIGCASGAWTSDVAKLNSQARCLGIDLKPPSNLRAPQNLSFVKADTLHDWDFTKDHDGAPFDFITARVLVAAIADWPAFFQKCYDHLEIGGWAEIHDIQIGTFSDRFDWRDETSPLMKWYQCFRRMSASQGVDGFASERRTEDLLEAGFSNVTESFYRCYLDEECVRVANDKEIAKLTLTYFMTLLDSVTNVMMTKARSQSQTLSVSLSEIEELKELAKRDVLANAKERKYYWIFSVHTAQKQR